MCESAWAVAHIMWHQIVCCCWRGRVYCHAALSAVLNLRSTVNDKVRACIGDLYIKHSYKSVPCELSDCSVKMCLCTFWTTSQVPPLAGSSLMVLSPVHNCMSLRLKTPLSSFGGPEYYLAHVWPAVFFVMFFINWNQLLIFYIYIFLPNRHM